MSPGLNRRDFLRLAGVLPISAAAPRWTRRLSAGAGRQNVLIIVFDALSACNIPLYGYARDTMPNLSRLARRAIVYHDHYAAASFTTPGTASLLTGAYSWSHRGILRNGQVAKSFIDRSVFATFDDYHRIAYSHNPLAYTLLNQFRGDIDELFEVQKLLLKSYDGFLAELFRNDSDIANVGWVRNTKMLDGYGYSLFFSHVDDAVQARKRARLGQEFPGGLAPWMGGEFFLLEEAIDWTTRALPPLPQPFLGYFHFLPPHAPYRAPLEFTGRFDNDKFSPVRKPLDEFAVKGDVTQQASRRKHYDEFVLYVDQQFGRLYDSLEKSGLLENTWLIFTSDHGEMFERGIKGHDTDALYQPVVRVPLLIFEPGREQGMDIHDATSAVDVLPTLAQLTGHAIPAWVEGTVLPPFAVTPPDPQRKVYAMRATRNDPAAPLTIASTMLVKGRYKLVYYFGYGGLGIPDHAKLFDLQADPEEMNELLGTQPEIAAAMLKELKDKLAEVNRPYA